MTQKHIEYKSVRISSSKGCILAEELLDLSLNNEAKNG